MRNVMLPKLRCPMPDGSCPLKKPPTREEYSSPCFPCGPIPRFTGKPTVWGLLVPDGRLEIRNWSPWPTIISESLGAGHYPSAIFHTLCADGHDQAESAYEGKNRRDDLFGHGIFPTGKRKNGGQSTFDAGPPKLERTYAGRKSGPCLPKDGDSHQRQK